MTKYFIIAGTPRSRTAWLSRFLSTGPVTCQHELLMKCESWEDFYARLDVTEYSGTADSGIGPYLPDVVEWLNPRILFVRREPSEAIDSLAAVLGNGPGARTAAGTAVRRSLRAIEIWRADPRALVVDFHALRRPEVMQQVWEHLIGFDQPFPATRFAAMEDVPIAIDPNQMMRVARRAISRGFPPLIDF